jgi:hypothetical protein
MRVLGDPALAKSLGDRASERFEAHYQASIMARALENLFLTLLAERRGAAQLTGGLEHA